MKQPIIINKTFFDIALKPHEYNKKIAELYKTDPVPEKFIPVFDIAMHRLNMKILKSIDNGGRRSEKRGDSDDRRKGER